MLMEEFTDLELRIFTLNPDENSDFTYEENYYTAISSLNNWIRSKNLDQGILNINTTNNATLNGEQSQVKLPKIHIPFFSGEYSEWQSFYDMYTSTIHEAPGLNSVQKFQYLKGLLKGEAAVLLRHISITEGNYIGALNKLKERYDRKKHIISTFIRTFIKQPAINTLSAANVKRLMDTSDEVIRGLQALGEIAETRDPWLIYLLMQKLDDKSKALWAEYSAEMINPKFSEFRRIDTLETVISSNKRANPKIEIKSHIVSGSSEIKVKVNNPVKESSSVSYQCGMCNQSHSLFCCNEFQELDAKPDAKYLIICYHQKNHYAKINSSATMSVTLKGGL